MTHSPPHHRNRPVTVREAIHLLTTSFEPAAGDLAREEAETTLITLLGVTRHELYLGDNPPLTRPVAQRLCRIIRRRRSGTPLAYALGMTYFHSAELRVTPDVLIPRPDTETLVEMVLDNEGPGELLLLDMGTGSGALTTVLLRLRQSWRAVATDISPKALRVAAANTAGLPVHLVCADRIEAIRCTDQPFDLVVSNPPYVTRDELETLDRQVRDFEPRIALDGGPDGLDFYRYLAAHAARVLRPDGRLYVEIGASQADAVTALLEHEGWRAISVRRDLGDRPRAVRAVRPAGHSRHRQRGQ
ncbi:MAG: peptide chain release factor N(5)-glutamine methyltransferase [Chitinivibrionales bacterium]|nr:peptide chain release factor N(5)-glutamine methyltransferase [Chitinivibrionales bacterium]